MVTSWVTVKAALRAIYWRRWPLCGPSGTAARSQTGSPAFHIAYIHCFLAISLGLLGIFLAVVVGECGHIRGGAFGVGEGLHEGSRLGLDLKRDFNEVVLLLDFVVGDVGETGGLLSAEGPHQEQQDAQRLDTRPHD
jgi:hypothetical protein